MDEKTKGKVVAAAIGVGITAVSAYIGLKADGEKTSHREQEKRDTKTHETNEKIRLEDKKNQQKLDYNEQRHQQELRHMKELAELKQQLAKAEEGEQTVDEESPWHELLVADATPEEYSAEDYEDVEDGGVSELMGEWIHENDVVILFAPTGVGKSILSMQIATDLARGVPTQAWPVTTPPKQQHVLYVDLEMMPKEQKQRYGARFKELPNFKTLHYYGKQPEKIGFFNRIAEHVQDIEERNILVIIDNLDRLISKWKGDISGEVTDKMFTLVYNAKTMLDKEVTVIIVGHTRKRNKKNAGVDTDDLFGTSHQANAAKTLISVEPMDGQGDYFLLKLLKNRNGAKDTIKAKRFTADQPGNWHFEWVDEASLNLDSQPVAQPDSALPPIGVTEKVTTDEKYRLSADEFGKLHDAEKMVIYGIVKQELSSKTTGVKIAERMQERLNVKVSPTIVSTINKDTGEMRKRYADALDPDVVNKVRELYFSHNEEDKE